MPKIGQIIKNRRLELGLTMKQLSVKAEVSEASVSRWESGSIKTMKCDTAIKVASALQLPPLFLIGKEPPVGKSVKIPILKKIISDKWLFAPENTAGMIAIDASLYYGAMFATRVADKSMEPQISKNDLLIIRKQEFVDDDSIVMVTISGNGPTVKQVKKSKDGIVLTGFNISLYSPHFYTNREIEELPIKIIGKVVESRHEW